jgi:hypothetical protein
MLRSGAYKNVSYHVLYSHMKERHVMQNQKVPSLTSLNVVAAELRHFKAERSARHLGLAIGIISYMISRDAKRCGEK